MRGIKVGKPCGMARNSTDCGETNSLVESAKPERERYERGKRVTSITQRLYESLMYTCLY